jgi:hypothetical protein
MRNRAIAILGFILPVLAAGDALARSKTDVVVVKNGDRVTCEIKSLSVGMLTAKTDAMGTVEIKWEDVIAVRSAFTFRLETSDGLLFVGSLEEQEGSGMLVVAGVTSVGIPHLDVVEITPIERNFWDRNDGSLSVGFSYTRATDLGQFTFDWSNLYGTERTFVTLKASSTITDEGADQELSRRIDISLAYYRLLKASKWVVAISPTLQRNDELGLRRRIMAGAGAGLNMVKSYRSTLLVFAGAALNSEVGVDTAGTVYSADGILSASYSFFKYHSPKRNINTTLVIYPSLTEQNRYRLDYNLTFRVEVFKDFFVDLTYYENYDSEPPTEGAHKRDYGIVTSLGWSY